MKRGIGKRGLSPVVASVLMILLVLVLASIIFLWARGFIGEQVEKFGEPIENYCAKVSFVVSMYDNELEILNTGNVDIHNFNVKRISGGDSEVTLLLLPADDGESVQGFISLEMSDGSVPEEILVYPVLVGNVYGENKNSVFNCLDAGVKIL